MQKSRLSGRDRKFQCYHSENPICSNRQGLGPRSIDRVQFRLLHHFDRFRFSSFNKRLSSGLAASKSEVIYHADVIVAYMHSRAYTVLEAI